MADNQAIETARFEQILRRLEYLRNPNNSAPRTYAIEQILSDDEELRKQVIDFLSDISAYDGEYRITVNRLRRLRESIQEATERRVTKEILGASISLADFPKCWAKT